MGVIIFNGISSLDYNLEVEAPPKYVAAQRIYESVQVPGRSRDLHISSGCFENVPREYEVSFVRGHRGDKRPFAEMSAAIASWLNSANGYARLEDTYDYQFYRMARYVESLEIESIFNEAGKFTLTFDCGAQRFYKTGENPIEITRSTTLTNPSRFIALPTINVTGKGNVKITIGGKTVEINLGTTKRTATIDCERQDVYSGSANLNPVTKLGDEFPSLQPGNNRITLSGTGLDKIEVIPHWWTI